MKTLTRLLPATLTALALCSAGWVSAKTIMVTVPYGFTTLDPYDANDTLSQNVVKSIYEGLFGFDHTMKLIPVLADSYSASADGLTYTVKLKSGVKFSDGEPFNAAAVKANFDRVLDPKMGLSRYGLYKNIAEVKVVDDLTVEFHLKTAFSAFINTLAHPSGAMICPKTLEAAQGKKAYTAFNACGTGPYLQDQYNPSERLVVKKNPNYRVAGLPKLDAIIFRPTVEAGTVAAMLKTGEAQFAETVAPEQVPALSSDPKIQIEKVDMVVEGQVYLNVTKKPFSDVRVRQALNYAVNKEALCKVVYHGYCKPATGIAPVGIDYAKQFGVWPYDIKKAKELLAQAGYPNGFEATLWSASNASSSQKLLQFLQQQFRQVGVKVTVRALESGQRVSLMESVKGPQESKMDMAYWGWSSSTGELDWVIRPLLATTSWPPALSNYGFYSNKEVDQGIQDALLTTDRAKKTEIYNKVQDILWQDCPWVYLYVSQSVSAHDKRLKNFYLMPDGGFEFSQAEWVE